MDSLSIRFHENEFVFEKVMVVDDSGLLNGILFQDKHPIG